MDVNRSMITKKEVKKTQIKITPMIMTHTHTHASKGKIPEQ